MISARRPARSGLAAGLLALCAVAFAPPTDVAAAETTTSKGDRLPATSDTKSDAAPQPADRLAPQQGKSDPQSETAGTQEAASGGGLPPVHYSTDALPERVLNTRNALLHAASTGEIENLRAVIEQNELMPMVSFGGAADPIAYWKEISSDGTGRDVLAELIKVLTSGFVLMEPGTDREMFIWPYHYAYPLDRLTPAQEVELYLLITPEERENMLRAGSYLGYRAGIGPDGTLHFFIAGD
ncbi:hypothetical protein HW532_04800 [Kaustia mangrovi]|uniref:Uncharacterized protein n=1 Tax=Kaustia mangrovi TaxID=2593653 RepID=A0A7S8C2E2_9HYPH|nr:hypothetical protein [Kaustia mangrovi]QPC42086.1 hypothetical protein HW532_04800 [Kaustia mangrovi]